MAASVQFRPQNRDLGMVMREVDEDLAIFLGIRNGEKERNDRLLVKESDEFDDSKSAEPTLDSLLTVNASQAETFLVAADDNFLNLELEKSDDNWLLTQPHNSLLPSVEADVQDSAASQTKTSNSEGISLISELENTCEVSASASDSSSKLATSTSAESSAAGNRRPLSSEGRKPTRRAATPTGRPSLSAKSKPSRASTPTSRATLPSSKPVAAQTRSSTPVRPTSRSSTPASRPSIPVIKSASRSATPTRKPATPSTTSTISTLDRSSSGRKTGSTMLKSSVPSRGTSPTVKLRPSKPSEILSLSQDAPQNPKVSMPKRPSSASRGRPSSPATLSSNEKPRQKSCSPAKVRAPISSGYKTGSKILPKSRGCSNEGDDVNPVVMGTKMVDRVVNMRKLAPPKQDEYVTHDNLKKSSQENSGFGRSLSKKSLDMAIRHMDIRRTIPDKL